MKFWGATYGRLLTDKHFIEDDCTATLTVSLESVLVSAWYTLIPFDTDQSPLSGFFLPRPTAHMCLRASPPVAPIVQAAKRGTVWPTGALVEKERSKTASGGGGEHHPSAPSRCAMLRATEVAEDVESGAQPVGRSTTTAALQGTGRPARALRGVVADMRLVGAQETMVRVVGTLMGGMWVAWVMETLAGGPKGRFVMVFLSTKNALGM